MLEYGIGFACGLCAVGFVFVFVFIADRLVRLFDR